MASIMKRGDSYSVRYKYKDHSGKPCEGWESFKTKKEAQELRTYDIEKFYATLAKTPCGQYVKGIKQDLTKKQKKRLRILLLRRLVLNGISIPYLHSEVKGIIPVPGWAAGSYNGPVGEAYFLEDLYHVTRKQEYRDFVLRTADILMEAAS